MVQPSGFLVKIVGESLEFLQMNIGIKSQPFLSFFHSLLFFS